MKRSRGIQGPQGGVFCFVLFVMGFGLLYTYGAGQAKSEGLRQTYQLKNSHNAARVLLDECKREYNQLTAEGFSGEVGGTVVQQLSERNKQLEAANEDLYDQNKAWEQRSILCSEKLIVANQKKGEEKKMAARHLELQNEQTDLVEKTQRLSGTNGMRTILLRYNLKRLAGELNELRQALGMQSVKVNDDAYLDELVAKWKERNASRMDVGSTIRPVQMDEQSERLPISPYDPDRDAEHIFWPKKTSDGEYVIPGWQGRYGTQDLRHGTFVGSSYQPITDINKQMRTLYDYVICAVGLNITKFMYPSLFKSCKDCPTEYLHQYIETPLILFCDDCVPQHHTNEFKMLCRGFLDHDQYGSGLFWRARSRLRFKGKYILAAEKWRKEHDFGQDKVTLAVRIPRSEAFAASCDPAKPTPCYTHLLKGKTLETKAEGCLPSWEHIAQSINKYLERHQGHQVYVSTDCTEQEFQSLQAMVSVPLYRRHSTGHITEDSIIDTFICALSDHLHISKYEKKSTLIAEAFLLQNNLRTRNITVW